MSQVVFFVVASSIWIAGHVYVGQRLIKPLAPSVRVKWGFWGVWGLLMLLAPVSLLLRRTVLPEDVGVAVNLVVFLHMGAFLMLLVASVLRDLGWGSLVGVDRVLRWVRDRAKETGAAAASEAAGAVVGVILPGEPSRRAFLQNVFNLSMVGTVGTLTGIGVHEAHKKVGLNRVDVPIRGLPAPLEGFTIVQISDTHIGPSLKGDFLQEVVETIGGVDADLIAVTGDLIDGYVPDMGHEVRALSQLRAPHGVYFVTGNHEH